VIVVVPEEVDEEEECISGVHLWDELVLSQVLVTTASKVPSMLPLLLSKHWSGLATFLMSKKSG